MRAAGDPGHHALCAIPGPLHDADDHASAMAGTNSGLTCCACNQPTLYHWDSSPQVNPHPSSSPSVTSHALTAQSLLSQQHRPPANPHMSEHAHAN